MSKLCQSEIMKSEHAGDGRGVLPPEKSEHSDDAQAKRTYF